MKKKNLIIFDIDGTLTESVEIHQKAFTEMLYEIGVKDINKEYKNFKHHTDSYIAKEIYENVENKKFSENKRTQFEKGLTEKICSQKISEIDGAKKLIEDLENSIYGICYATGSLLRPAKHKLESIQIDYTKELLIASDEIHSREEIVSKAIRESEKYYNVEKFERIISVGDGIWDLRTAQNLNIDFIGVGIKNKEILKENGAKVVFENLTKFKIK